MFDLLTNILIWIVAVPVLVLLFKNIPSQWFKAFGLFIFVAVIIIIFAHFKFVESPVVREILNFLGFPFTLCGLFLIIVIWRIKAVGAIKLRSGEAKFVGEKFDNKAIEGKIKTSFKIITIALIALFFFSNNFFSQVLVCYLSQQAKYAVAQAYRRPIKDMKISELQDLQNQIFDIIVVPLVENEVSAKPRLLEVLKFIETKRNRKEPTPVIVLSGGESIYENGYPCKIEPEKENIRPLSIVKQEVAGTRGLLFDTRLEGLFNNRQTLEGEFKRFDLTQADEMCSYLVKLSNVLGSNIKPSIVLEPNAKTLKSSVDEVTEIIKKLKTQKVITDPSPSQTLRILLMSPSLKTSREFLAFDRKELNVIPYPVEDECTTCIVWEKLSPDSSEMVWQILIKNFRFDYLRNSFQAISDSEQVWSEVKELISYTLRFWIRPPLSDERPYYPKQPTDTTSPTK